MVSVSLRLAHGDLSMSANLDARAWLGALLRTRRIPMPNGRPLYAYKCSDEECAEARPRLQRPRFHTGGQG